MKSFEKNIINLYGKKGGEWLDNLPKMIAQLEGDYGFLGLKPLQNLSHHYVLSGFQGEQPVVLKLGLDIEGLKREYASLMAFSGFGAVQVVTENEGFIVQKCAIPGISLKSYFPQNDDGAIEIASNLIKTLHKAPIPYEHRFPILKDWLAVLDQDLEIPANYLEKARIMRDNLLKTSAAEVLLHGDLHHDNILQNGHNWVVIDPKGVIGDQVYEIAAFIRNPIPEIVSQDNIFYMIQNRIERFAKRLEISRDRITDWCFVHAVLSWGWDLEDGSDQSFNKELIGIFDRLSGPSS